MLPAADRLPEIIRRLRQRHPDFRCELHYENPLQLLIAVILSAQCTDVRVNLVTPALFARFPTAADLAGANRAELEEIVRSTGFYRQKARFIQETAHKLVHNFGGQVPSTMAELLTLSGVARKTANVVLGEIFGIAEGIVVDTHVKRLANRLGLTTATDPQKIEQELMAIVPHDEWIAISHLLIFHGRRVCAARKPDCAHCPLTDLCPAAFTHDAAGTPDRTG
ncbi:MAG: endonuclease III [Candidatus Promineifilaceae bacterium]